MLEGASKKNDDDVPYQLLSIGEITGGTRPKMWTTAVKKLKKHLKKSKSEERDHETYKNLKHVEAADGREIPKKECLLLVTATGQQNPFAVLLRKRSKGKEYPWEVIAMQSEGLLKTDRFKQAKAKEKIVLIEKMLEMVVENPDIYSIIHLVYPK